ncbi:hypothetical protein HDU96_003885 [Phlyctochytrium bullatum]|nr:hypothetical protein HDU96_003885 [Phlyctochytrium bullatum]
MSTAVKDTTSPAVAAPSTTPEGQTIVSNFCFCGTLRTGAQVCTILATILSFAALALDVTTILFLGLLAYISMVFAAINLFWTVVHIIGAVGVFRRKLPLIRFHAVAYCIYALLPVIRVFISFRSPIFLGINLLLAGLHIYFAIVVWSHYQLERSNAANAGAVVVTAADVDIEAGSPYMAKAQEASK